MLRHALTSALKKIGMLVLIGIISFAILLNIARALTPLLNKKVYYFEQWATNVLHQKTHIGKIRAAWSGFEPALRFQNVEIIDTAKNQSLLHIQSLLVGIDLLQSILHWQLLPEKVELNGTTVNLSTSMQSPWQIGTITGFSEASDENRGPSYFQSLIRWMLTEVNVSLKHVTIHYQLSNGAMISIKELELHATKNTLHQRISGTAMLFQSAGSYKSQQLLGRLSFILNMNNAKNNGDINNADLYISGRDLNLSKDIFNQWFYSDMNRIAMGEVHGQLQAWIEWRGKRLKSIHSVIDANQVQVKLMGVAAPMTMSDLHLNSNIEFFSNGFEIAGDQMRLSMNGQNWPENAFALRYIHGKKAEPPMLFFKIKELPLSLVHLTADYLSQRFSDHYRRNFLTWLSQGLLAGHINNVRFNMANLDAGGNNFDADLDHVTLHYSRHWPDLTDLQGHLKIQGKILHIVSHHTKIADKPLDYIEATISDLDHPVMMISGHTHSDLSSGLQFLQLTPLAIAKQTKAVTGSGYFDLALKLRIPLWVSNPDIIADGKIQFEDATLQKTDWPLALQQLNGVFTFHNHQVEAKDLLANYDGLPQSIAITTLAGDAKKIEVHGKISLSTLREKLHFPLLNYAEGITDYHLLMILPNVKQSLFSHLELTSNLVGVETFLPAPYAKKAVMPMPLRLVLNRQQLDTLQWQLNYGDLFSALLIMHKKIDRWQLYSGEIHLGNGLAKLQNTRGLLITGNVAEIDGVVWKEFLKNLLKSTSNILIRAMEFHIADFRWHQYRFLNTDLSITPIKTGWALILQNANMAGRLFIPKQPANRWQGNFSRLYLQQVNAKSSFLRPNDLPSLSLSINDFRYGEQIWGNVNLKTTASANSLIINKLTVTQPAMNIVASGQWQSINQHTQTHIEGQLTSNNLGALLKNWHVTHVVSGGEGGASFSLFWPGSPQQFSKSNLNGEVQYDFRRGRMTQLSQHAESELGFGRLLNLLSLQSLPLLPLNLVHLTQKGFSFSLFKGDFQLLKGNAAINDAALVGPLAWVRVNGRIGLAAEDYDLALEVIPNVTSSLPLIVGLAGGPIAGAITWVADKLLAKHLGKAAEIDYRITGSFKKPSIIKLPKPEKTIESVHGGKT